MFARQGSMLEARLGQLAQMDQAALVANMNGVLDIFSRVLTGCGGGHRDTDGAEYHFFGNSPNTAGTYDGDDIEAVPDFTADPDAPKDHAILRVTQQNPNAGSTTNPRLYSAIFEGPVHFTHPPRGVLRVATATANWVNPGAHPLIPTVAATDDETGDALTIQLHRSSPATDPNVRSGYSVIYAYDVHGQANAIYGYLDDKIGMIKLWSGSTASIPGGWQICDGSNSTPDLRDRFVVGAGSTYAVGATGGATTHTHTGTTDSGGSHTHTGTTDSDGAHTHTGTTASGGSHDHGGATGSDGNHSHGGGTGTGTTGNAVTGITLGSSGDLTAANNTTGITVDAHPDHSHEIPESTFTSFDAGGGATTIYHADAETRTTKAPSITLSHTVNDSGHTHNVPTHNHTITEPNSGTGHNHSVPSLSIAASGTHTHSISNQAAHTHTFTTDSGGSHTHTFTTGSHAGHTHTFTTGSSSSLPPYYALAWIARVS